MTQRTIVCRSTFRFYQEKPEQSFGFSGRAAYALGFDKPNFPVPMELKCDWCASADHTCFGPGEYCPDRKKI